VDEAMEMYQELHRWDEALAVAEAKVRTCVVICQLVTLYCMSDCLLVSVTAIMLNGVCRSMS